MRELKRIFIALSCSAFFVAAFPSKAADIDELTASVEKGDLEKVNALLKAGVKASDRDSLGWYPVSKAASAGQLEIMAVLVQNGADINKKTGKQNTPLIFAASRGHAEVVSWLIEKGADVHHANRSGATAQALAQSNDHFEIAVFLAEAAKGQVKPSVKAQAKIKTPAPFVVPQLDRKSLGLPVPKN